MTFADWVIIKCLKYFKQGSYSNIEVSCLITDDPIFFDFICDVLELIKEFDQRRYKRVLTELDWILNTRRIKIDCGQYRHSIKLCSIHCDLSREPSKEDLIYTASVIIHEATHGYIFSKGFKYIQENREQIERICVAEENRFLIKVADKYPEISDRLIREFNPQNWHQSWNDSRWTRIKKEFSLIYRSEK